MASPYSYVSYIKLPQTTKLPVLLLMPMYLSTLMLDYVLIKNEKRLSITPLQLRSFIGLYHFMLPLFFDSRYDFANISFMLQPWILAIQIFFMTESHLTLTEWLLMMIKVATFQDETPNTESDQSIRLQGIKKLVRGIAKLGFNRIALQGLLPADLSILLSMRFYSPKAMFYTYVLAMRIYCMMSMVDVWMGILQIVFLVRFQDLFHNPFISISPKDFWNRRWNRAVSRMFHRFMFSKVSAKKGKQAKHQSFLMSSPTVCGLGVFFVSGLFHDFMIAAATRILTFEMTLFFMIHGIAVALEVNLFRKRIPPYSMTSRILCHVLTTLFFVTTGRLFLSPILRNQVFLRIANWF